MKDSAQRLAYEARQQLRKVAADYAAALLLGDPTVIAVAFNKLEDFADTYRKEKP